MPIGSLTQGAVKARIDWAIRLFAEDMARRVHLSATGIFTNHDEMMLIGKEASKLSATTILLANAAMYRYEMHSRRPPTALAVQKTDANTLSVITCECGPGTEIGALRASFTHADRPTVGGTTCPETLEYRPPGMMRLLRGQDPCGSYDILVKTRTRDSLEPQLNVHLPRDEKANRSKVLGSEVASKTRRWLDANRLISPLEWNRVQWEPAYNPFVHDFEDVDASTREALGRMLRVLWAYHKYGSQYFSMMIDAMVLRAMNLCMLGKFVSAMQEKHDELPNRNASAFHKLVTQDSVRLGDALWPYLPAEVSYPIMCACKPFVIGDAVTRVG